jgi:Ig-like domain CHU_C associated
VSDSTKSFHTKTQDNRKSLKELLQNLLFYYLVSLFSHNVTKVALLFCVVFVNSIAFSQSTLVAPVGGLSYQWYKNGNPIAGATYINYAPNSKGVYYAHFINTNGTQCQTDIYILEELLGAAVTLNLTGFDANTTISWSNGATTPSITVSASSNVMTYTATQVSDNGACVQQSVFKVQYVNFNMPINTVCEADGQYPNLINLTAPQSGFDYQWYKNGLAIPGANFSNYTATSAGVYQAYFVDGGGCKQQTEVFILENVCILNYESSSKVTLKVEGYDSNTTIKWSTGATTPTISVNPTSNVISYSATLTSDNGACIEEMKFKVMAFGCITPPVINTSARCGAGSITLTGGYCSGTIQWYDSSSTLNVAATGNTFTIPNLSQSKLYYASCKIGLCESKRVGVLADILPIPISEIAPMNPTCLGVVTLPNGSIIATKYYISDSYSITEGTSFSSSFNGVFNSVPPNGVLTNTLKIDIIQSYTVRFLSSNGCIKDQTIVLTNVCPTCPINYCIGATISHQK